MKKHYEATPKETLINILISSRETIQKRNKEIVRLKELCDKYEEEHKTTFEEWKKTINIKKEVREYIEKASYLQGNKILEEKELLKILDKVD